MSVQPIPEGYHTVTPYLIVKGAARALDFYARAFGAVETMRMEEPDGRIAHAEIRVGTSPIMLADENPAKGAVGPDPLGGSSVHLFLYVEDVDAFADRAVDAGAALILPVADQSHGDRMGGLRDPFGHTWYPATRLENLTPDEIRERQTAPVAT